MEDTIDNAALVFIARHAAEHLDADVLVQRTADRLAERFEVSRETAFAVASSAWGEFEGNHASYIDTTRTTTRCLVLQLDDGGTAALSTRHLIAALPLLKQAGMPVPERCPTHRPTR